MLKRAFSKWGKQRKKMVCIFQAFKQHVLFSVQKRARIIRAFHFGRIFDNGKIWAKKRVSSFSKILKLPIEVAILIKSPFLCFFPLNLISFKNYLSLLCYSEILRIIRRTFAQIFTDIRHCLEVAEL